MNHSGTTSMQTTPDRGARPQAERDVISFASERKSNSVGAAAEEQLTSGIPFSRETINEGYLKRPTPKENIIRNETLSSMQLGRGSLCALSH